MLSPHRRTSLMDHGAPPRDMNLLIPDILPRYELG
jgi:hypothetical protein